MATKGPELIVQWWREEVQHALEVGTAGKSTTAWTVERWMEWKEPLTAVSQREGRREASQLGQISGRPQKYANTRELALAPVFSVIARARQV